MFGGTPELELVGLEDSTAPYESAKQMNMVELGQVQRLKNATKKGTWPSWPSFLVMFEGTPKLELVGLEDSTAPYESAKRMNMVELGQVQRLKNTTKKGTWPSWPTPFRGSR